jgi:spoIIIJ-associated protein
VSEGRRQEAAALLSEVIAKMGMEATVSHEPTEDGGVRLNVQSNDSAILIGRKGKNLQALQYLVNRMATAAETTEMPERILVDIENYLDRRRASLEEMARQLAQKAKESGRDIRLKPLSPQERRIIHLTLQDDPDVRTFSMGNSVLRTVVISPKSAGRDEGRPKRQRGGAGRRDARDRGPRSRRPSGERPPAQETNQPSEPAQEPGQPSEPAQGDTQEP